MIELFLVKPNEMVEIPTESITWSGRRYQAARKIEANILYTKKNGHQYTKVSEGDTVLFKWQGKEVFRGTVFNRSRTKSGMLSVVAYDMLQYLILNRDVYVFTKKRADEILKRICKDFQIPYSAIANTKQVLKSLVFKNETSLYDMVLKALIETHKQTNSKFQLWSSKGKLHLREWPNSTNQWVLETGVNIIDYTYSTSIDDTATRVKLVGEKEVEVIKVIKGKKKSRTKKVKEKRPISAIVTDQDGKKKYGVLQYFEHVSGNINQAQLNDRAKKRLSKKKGVKRELELEALGIADIISGVPVYVIEKDLGISKTFFVDEDTHMFQGKQHSMTVKLIEKNTVEAVS
ncbi:XkdQ/YqbQ family protein [Heyndrickxia sp. NPDC080065]|uniref:XkdQ/YqbQ family protein n=1 Tax=Heyndrickxia sp. NPDC080065 TaxID=3390568 RepID=UPI003D06E997